MVEKRSIGASGIEVAPLALGGNVFDWTADEATSFAILDAFVDAGGTMIIPPTSIRAGCRVTKAAKANR